MMICPKVSNKIPNPIFYNPKNSGTYKMIDIKKGVQIGEMTVVPRMDLYISSLYIQPEFRKMGYGTKFLDFARKISEQMGLNGNLRVMAGTLEDISNPSHIFFRKYGFTSDNPKLSIIDDCIKNKIPLNSAKISLLYMYFTK